MKKLFPFGTHLCIEYGGQGRTLEEHEFFAAADLNNNGSLNILEAVNVLNVVKGKTDYSNIATAPAAESEVAKISNKEITTKTNK